MQHKGCNAYSQVSKLFEARSRIKQERINKLVIEMSAKLNTKDEMKLDLAVVEMEEYGDLFENVIREVAKRKMSENIAVLSDILIQPFEDKDLLKNELLEQMIAVISSLTNSELVIVKRLKTYHDANKKYLEENNENKPIDFRLDYSKEIVLDLPIDIFRSSFDSLISKGLAIDDSVGRFGGGQRDFIKPSSFCILIFENINYFKNLESVDSQ